MINGIKENKLATLLMEKSHKINRIVQEKRCKRNIEETNKKWLTVEKYNEKQSLNIITSTIM